MLVARATFPLPETRWPRQVELAELGRSGLQTVGAPEGYLVEARIAADVLSLDRSAIWLRPGVDELDGASLASLAAEVRGAPTASPQTVVVAAPVGAGAVLKAGEANASQLLLTTGPIDPGPTDPLGQMAVDVAAATAVAERAGARLPHLSLERLVRVSGGRAAVIDSALSTSAAIGWRPVASLVSGSPNLVALVAAICAVHLDGLGGDQASALHLAACLGYAHPRLSALAPALAPAEEAHWWQPLVNGWYRMDPFWRSVLLAWSRTSRPDSRRLARLVGELESEHAWAEAIDVCLGSRAPDLATEVVADWTLASLGVQEQHELGRVVGRLSSCPASQDPERILSAARLAAAEGRLEIAHDRARRAAQRARRNGQPGAGGEAERLARQLRRCLRARSPTRRLHRYFALGPSLAIRRDPIVIELGDSRLRAEAVASRERVALDDALGDVPRGSAGPTISPSSSRATSMRAHCFGPFELWLDDRTVENWSGARGLAILKYLLLHRGRPALRDVLMDVLWPEAPAASGANRLHVALHTLRSDLRQVSPEPIVVRAGSGYALAPSLAVWVDVEEFARVLREGAEHERVGAIPHAISAYAAAVELYRGPLLEDTPYLDWAITERERLTLAHADVLEGLARCHFAAGAYAACVAVCERLVQEDGCREEAHRLLMRCYMRQNQPHRAARQFAACVRALRDELDMLPDAATVELYRSVRERRAV